MALLSRQLRTHCKAPHKLPNNLRYLVLHSFITLIFLSSKDYIPDLSLISHLSQKMIIFLQTSAAGVHVVDQVFRDFSSKNKYTPFLTSQ